MQYINHQWEDIEAIDDQEAKKIFRNKIGLFNLELYEIIKIEYDSIELENNLFSISLNIRATPKAVKWIEYLNQTGAMRLLSE